MSKKPQQSSEAFERYVSRGERLLGVPTEALRAALVALEAAYARESESAVRATRGHRADPVLAVLTQVLGPLGIELQTVYDARPRVAEVLVTKELLLGEGAVSQNLAPHADMGGRHLWPGDRLRVAIFRAERRHSGLAMFALVPPTKAPVPPWSFAAFVLLSEKRVWLASVEEILSVLKTTRKGEMSGRVRRMKNGHTVRFEFAVAPSDYDHGMRIALVDETRRRKDRP